MSKGEADSYRNLWPTFEPFLSPYFTMRSGEEATVGAVLTGGTEPAARGGRAGRLEIPGGAEGAA